MKVLIIGAKGMLGQAMGEAFAGNELALMDREEIDITKNADCRLQIAELKPEIVINCAAYTNVDKAEEEQDAAYKINGYAVGNLAAVCKELDIPLVHFSTEYVFDGESERGYDESAKPNPVSAYGRSKLLGEEELQKNTDKYYLIRLSRLFGKNSPSPSLEKRGVPSLLQREGKGEFQRKKSFVQLMLDLAEKQNEIEVVDEEVSSPTYAPDLAKLTRHIIENKLPYGVYHGANSGSCTWHGFAREIFKIAGKNAKLKAVPSLRFPRPAKRPAYAVLLNTKLPPQRPWQDALNEFLMR